MPADVSHTPLPPRRVLRVDASEIFRAVRRRQGWNQRQLAASTGAHPRTIAAVEAGSRRPSLALLEQVLSAAGLELAADLPAVGPPPEVLRYLTWSLTRRLRRSVGAVGPSQTHGPLWRQLRELAVRGDVVLHGDAAVALWLPPPGPLTRVQVCFRRRQPWELPPTPDVDLLPSCAGHAAALVQVGLESWEIGDDPPAELALHPAHAARRLELRGVARVLHQKAAVDLGGRRVAAHKDAAHVAEQHYVFHTKAYGQRPMPDREDRRGWRLRDDASLSAWLARYGYPE